MKPVRKNIKETMDDLFGRPLPAEFDRVGGYMYVDGLTTRVLWSMAGTPRGLLFEIRKQIEQDYHLKFIRRLKNETC